MGKLTFNLRAAEAAPSQAAADPSLLWTFALVAALSAVAFAAVWFITAALGTVSP